VREVDRDSWAAKSELCDQSACSALAGDRMGEVREELRVRRVRRDEGKVGKVVAKR
jgi:hypothetical protein